MSSKTQRINLTWGLDVAGHGVRLLRVVRRGEGYCANEHRWADLLPRWEGLPDWGRTLGQLKPVPRGEPMVACLADELVLYRELRLPGGAGGAEIEPTVFAQMVAAQAEVALPMATEPMAWGWVVLGESAGAAGPERRVLLCAVRQSVLDRVSQAAAPLGRVLTIVPAGLALATGYSHLCSDAQAPTLLVDIAARHTSVLVLRRGRLVGCGLLDQGSDTWAEAVADDEELPLPEAEAAVRVQLAAAGAADAALGRALDAWTQHLRETLRDSLAELPESSHPKRCVLVGYAADSAALQARLRDSLGLPVTEPAISSQLDWALDAPVRASLAALGAALHGLNPQEPIVRFATIASTPSASSGRRPQLALAACAVWLLAAVLALYGLDLLAAQRFSAAVAARRAELADQTDGAQRELAVGAYLEKGATPPLAVLDELSKAAPRGLILSRWEYQRSGQVRLSGQIGGVSDLDKLLEAMAGAYLFEEVDLGRVNVEERKWVFDLSARTVPVFRYFARPTDAASPANPPAQIAQNGKTLETVDERR